MNIKIVYFVNRNINQKIIVQKIKYKKKKKLEFNNEISIKSLEKKPKNGGTPAKEKNMIVIKDKKKKLNFKSLKANKVLKFVLTICCKNQKRINNEKLYTNI